MKKNCVAPRAHRLTLVLLVLLIQLARRASHQVTYLSSERPPGVLPPIKPRITASPDILHQLSVATNL